ncbi:C-type lectin domain family 14 member A [Stigmatopora nigra]
MFLPRLWLLLLMLRLSSVVPNSVLRYKLLHSALTFDQAQEACLPHKLASFTGPGEFLQLIKVAPGSPSLFWVGLKKAKNQCVVPSLPLRGFKWVPGGSEDTDNNTRWVKEPEQTCTSVLCAALTIQPDGSQGLTPLSCKTVHPFICKLESWDQPTTEPARPMPTERETPKLLTAEPELLPPIASMPTEPSPVQTVSATPRPDNPESAEQNPDLVEPPTPKPARPEAGEPGNRPGDSDSSESVYGSCPHPAVTGARFLTLDPDNSSMIRVDCWSKVRLDLQCRHPPEGWHLLGGALANLSSVCTPCPNGYSKNASGDCEDMDECLGPHGCHHACVNTIGSYTCTCTDASGSDDETECEPTDVPGPFSGAMVPVLVGVALLLVLLLLALVIVKCCLKRRSKKAAQAKDKLAP